MALKKSERNLLIVLGLIAGVFLINKFVCSSGEEKQQTDQAKTKSTQKSRVADIASKVFQAEKSVDAGAVIIPKKHFETWGRDPFKPPYWEIAAMAQKNSEKEEKEDPNEKFTLKGLMHGAKGKNYVLINEIIVAEGEEVDGLRVVQIEKNHVLCRYGEETFTLEWKEEK